MDRPALVNAYLDQLLQRRRLSRHTQTNYGRDLDRLFALAARANGAPPEPQAVAPHEVRAALARLHSQGLAPRSIARTLSAWRGFFNWLVRHHGLGANPCAGLRAPKGKKALPKVLSPDRAAQLLDPKPTGDLESRDKAMFELLYSSGLRLAELHGLDLEAGRAAIADAEVTVLGKGRKLRSVPVGTQARRALAAWLELRALHAAPGEQALFVNARGTRLAMRTIQMRLDRWALRAGLGEGVHPHVLRHSFASHVLQSAGDLRAVQEMLGHSSISTTQIYTSLDWQHLAKVYDAAHPRAKRKK